MDDYNHEYWKPWQPISIPSPLLPSIEEAIGLVFICPSCKQVINTSVAYSYCPFCGSNLFPSSDPDYNELMDMMTRLMELFTMYLDKKYEEKTKND
jgi:hypothetical protein